MIIDTSHPVDRTGNRFCGPLVVASILGTSTGDVAQRVYDMRSAGHPAARKMKRVTRDVKGTVTSELRALLSREGYALHDVDVGARYRPKYFCASYVNDAGTRFALRAPPILSTDDWLPWVILKRACGSLGSFLRCHGDGTYIVNTPGHWAIASGGKWCETLTGGNWVDRRAAPKQTRRVVHAWQVERAS